MKLKLTIEVPSSADRDAVLIQLRDAQQRRQGITVVTPAGYATDVDLSRIERVGA